MMLSVVLVTCSLGLSACGSKDNNESNGNNNASGTESSKPEGNSTTDKAKELSVQLGPDPETIDPALNSAIDGGNMIIHAYEGLLSVDKDNNIIPGQAEKHEVSEDGLTWTFHLRDGLKWSDGSALTANDFVYSWKRVCDPALAAPYAETVLGMVKGYEEAVGGNIDALAVSAPDEKTFVVELANPCPYFESLAAFATLNPVQQKTVEANGDSWAINADTYITNGCYYISEWVPGSHITMTKNPNYWNADAVTIDTLKFVLMEDANAAYSAYQTGELQLVKDVPTEEIPSLEGNEEFHVEPIIGTYYVSLNTTKKPFDNAKVRKALSLAIDREYVAGTLMQGTYTAATGYVGPGWKDTDGTDFAANANGGKPYIDNSNYDKNLEEAKKLLKEAGYENGEGIPALRYTTNDAGYHKPLAEYLQQAWKEIGITLDVEIVEWSSFTPMRRSGDFEIARNGWVGDYSDPSNMLEILYSTNGNNDGKYTSKEFDAALDIASKTLDKEERSVALHKAEDVLMEDAGCIPVAYYNDFWLQSTSLKGSWHSPNGYWYFMYAEVQ